ncbi:MAG: ABC transporter permease [Planctomycetota bacterium]
MIRTALLIAINDLHRLVLDRTALAFTLLFPLGFGLFYGMVVSEVAPPHHATVAVIGGDSGDASLVRDELLAHPAIEFAEPGEPADAVLRLPDDLTLPRMGTPGELPQTLISVELDPRRIAEGAIVKSAVRAASWQATLHRDLPASRDVAGQPPVRVELTWRGGVTPPESGFSLSFPQAVVWAVLACAATFGASMVAERRAGTLARLRAAPVGFHAVILGKALACAAVAGTTGLALAAIGTIWLGVPVAHPAQAGAALIAAAIASAGLMMLVATLSSRRAAAGQIAWAIVLVLAMSGGAMLPVAFMPEWLQQAGALSPARWAIEALEAATWRRSTWADLSQPLTLLIGTGVGGFVVGHAIFARSTARL